MQPNPYYPPPPPPARPDRTRLWLTILAVLITVGIIGLVVEVIVLTRDDNSASSSASTNTSSSRTTPRSNVDDEEATARKKCQTATADLLKDPASVQFRGITVRSSIMGKGKVWQVHGEINGKNSYGAYSGYSSFSCVAIRSLEDGSWNVPTPSIMQN